MIDLKSRLDPTRLAPSSASPSPRGSTDGSRSNSPSSDGRAADKYLLRVTAGPGYDLSTHKTVAVNGNEVMIIENEFMTIRLKVRIRGYNGLPRSSPSASPYFSNKLHSNDQYSIAWSFVPKVDIPAADTIWGNDFDSPIRDRLPPGFNTAFKIVKQFIDSSLECDAYADKPWLYGPALACWFAFRVGDQAGEDFAKTDALPEEKDVVEEGADGSGVNFRHAAGMPDSSDKRRKWALEESNRRKFVFEKGRVYEVDFFNPYLDFSNFALKLPGFSLGVLRYIGDKTHTLRYVFKNSVTGDVYMSVEFKLLHGQDLIDAVEVDGMINSKSETSVDDLD